MVTVKVYSYSYESGGAKVKHIKNVDLPAMPVVGSTIAIWQVDIYFYMDVHKVIQTEKGDIIALCLYDMHCVELKESSNFDPDSNSPAYPLFKENEAHGESTQINTQIIGFNPESQ